MVNGEWGMGAIYGRQIVGTRDCASNASGDDNDSDCVSNKRRGRAMFRPVGKYRVNPRLRFQQSHR